MKGSLCVRPLTAADAPVVSEMMTVSRAGYHQYFIPFALDAASIGAILGSAREDRYTGLWFDDLLVGFFMLRGLDAGYSVPSYGAYIRETYAGKGLLTLTLHLAVAECRLKGIPRLMLKVHPENTIAKLTYEKFGFVHTGHDQTINNLIYHYEIL